MTTSRPRIGARLAVLLRGFGLIMGMLALSACDRAIGETTEPTARPAYALAIHGGAGTLSSERLTPELQAQYKTTLRAALSAGEEMLREGHSAVASVVATLTVLEDSELFNAGKGAVFTHEGRNELDASIMDGRDLNAGAVAGVSTIKSPIAAALAVMRQSRHVMLSGRGAEAFAASVGLEIVDPEYFRTQRRWQELEAARSAQELRADANDESKFGTVGAVALDREGNLAAGTSTGGMTNKRWGRIGDSPIIGAGTYASNDSCAVSATGHGEFFIRRTVARDICALVEYAGLSLAAAAHQIIQEDLVAMGGEGGVIALDPNGNIVLEFNTSGMYRGSVVAGGSPHVAIFQVDHITNGISARRSSG